MAMCLLLLGAAAGYCVAVQAQTPDAEVAARRAAAVTAARGGEFSLSVAELETLRASHPDVPAIQYDLATVLAWSEADAAALDVAASFEPASAPRYTQLAVAKSARNLRQFTLAAEWYDAALAAESANVDALSGRLLTAADAGDAATARALIDQTAGLAATNTNIALARAYAMRTLAQSIPALRVYDDVLANDPNQRDALRGKALVLRGLLLPTQALEIAQSHPGVLTDAEIERLHVDEAAIQARLATRTPYPEPDVYEGRDRSLEAIQSALADTSDPGARGALELDLVVALADANRPDEAIGVFEALPPAVNTDQAYVLASAGSAYLQLREPEKALAVLQRASELDPANVEVQFQLIFALLDLDRSDEAYGLASRLTGELPMANAAAGTPIVAGNDRRMRAELAAGIAQVDGNQLDDAQARFEALLTEAANNGDVRQELALVYRWRGWLERSLEQYRQVLTMNQDSVSARVGLAHAQLDGREYVEVEETVLDVSQVYARESAVQRLEERWQLHNRPELYISAATGDSSGPITGANYYSVDAAWYTAPINYRYRAFVTTHDGYAEYPEGDGRRRRLGAGLEVRLPRYVATAAVSGSRSGGEAGFRATADYRFSDYWSLSSGLELNSDATQLRAYRLGIEADRVFLGARFAPSELASVYLGVDRTAYSDDNALDAISVNGRRRIVTRPRSTLDFTGSFSLSRSDTSNVPYYSPTRGRSALLGLSHRLRLHRRYERELSQTVQIAAGQSVQQGFDPGSIWMAAWRLDWTLSSRNAVSVELQRSDQFYDGESEYASVLLLAMNSRF